MSSQIFFKHQKQFFTVSFDPLMDNLQFFFRSYFSIESGGWVQGKGTGRKNVEINKRK